MILIRVLERIASALEAHVEIVRRSSERDEKLWKAQISQLEAVMAHGAQQADNTAEAHRLYIANQRAQLEQAHLYLQQMRTHMERCEICRNAIPDAAHGPGDHVQ